METGKQSFRNNSEKWRRRPVRCIMCGKYPERKKGFWIYFCEEHEDDYYNALETIMRKDWLPNRKSSIK